MIWQYGRYTIPTYLANSPVQDIRRSFKAPGRAPSCLLRYAIAASASQSRGDSPDPASLAYMLTVLLGTAPASDRHVRVLS